MFNWSGTQAQRRKEQGTRPKRETMNETATRGENVVPPLYLGHPESLICLHALFIIIKKAPESPHATARKCAHRHTACQISTDIGCSTAKSPSPKNHVVAKIFPTKRSYKRENQSCCVYTIRGRGCIALTRATLHGALIHRCVQSRS